jgi:phosphatidate phosphatase APP1
MAESRRRSILHRIALRIDRALDRREKRRGEQLPAESIEIVPYRSYGDGRNMHVAARVVRQSGGARRSSDPTKIDNIVDAWRRIRSAEIPFAAVVIRYRDQRFETRADEEGFLHFEFVASEPVASDLLSWHEVEIRLARSTEEEPVHAFAPVLIPGTRARFGVISDIDDTVIQTGATSLLKMARTLFLENAKTRIPFEGVSGFYRVLQEDGEKKPINPVFYVSSSPWNLYDMLIEYLEHQKIAPGPLLLQDYGVDESKLVHAKHDEHKTKRIDAILARYPSLPFVLIGDSGQHDPEIYAATVRRHPGRILAIYIRDVAPNARDREVHAIADEIAELEVPMILCRDTGDAARHAMSIGLFPPERIAEVIDAKKEDQAS